MTLKQIKVGRWYETTIGYGKAERVGGTFPPTAKMDIVSPLPRGLQYVRARDVKREATEAEALAQRIGGGQ